VAKLYEDFLDLLILDSVDEALISDVTSMGIEAIATNTIMKTMEDKVRLAGFVLKQVNDRQRPR
jgi:hypothetical protein